MTNPVKDERYSTLKKNKTVVEKKRIESIDDIFVDLNIKIRELSIDEISAKVRRKLLGNIDTENLPRLIAEINAIWGGRRKITVSKVVLPKDETFLIKILYQDLDKRNAEKTARGVNKIPVLEQCIPLFVKIEGLGTNSSFNTLLKENIKSEVLSYFGVNEDKIYMKNFRHFLAEEIVRAEGLRYALSRDPGKFKELVKYGVMSTLPYKYEHASGKVEFQPFWAERGNTKFSLPEADFVYRKNPPSPNMGLAFFVGVGVPKAYLSTFIRNTNAEGLGLGWFSEKYMNMYNAMSGKEEWTKGVTDDDLLRIEQEYRELARRFTSTCEDLGVGNYVVDYAGEKGIISAGVDKYLNIITSWTDDKVSHPAFYEHLISDEKSKLVLEKLGVTNHELFKENFLKLQQMVRDASSSKNILTTGASRMLQSMWYMEKFSLYDAFAPGKYKDYVVNIILQTYLSAFVKYRVADIQYAWEEEREKGDRARSYQDTKDFVITKQSLIEKSKTGAKLTKSEEVVKHALTSQLGKLFLDVELDIDTDTKLFDRFEKESLEFIARIGKFPDGNRFKVRKLGNHKALGLYYPEAKVLVVDVDSPSSFIHEYGHLLDYKFGKVSDLQGFERIVDTTIKILQQRFDALPETDQLKARVGGDSKYNFEYYARPSEIFARAFEVFCSLRLKINLSILKPREEYLNSFEYIGDTEYIRMISDYFGGLFAPKK